MLSSAPLTAAVSWRLFGTDLTSPSVNVILTCFMALPLVMSCAFLNLNCVFSEAQIMNRLVLSGCFKKMLRCKQMRGNELWTF